MEMEKGYSILAKVKLCQILWLNIVDPRYAIFYLVWAVEVGALNNF